MTKQLGRKQLGVTLIETMLVAVVIGMMFVMYVGYTEQRTRTMTIDRASQQMQQILNAALSYYIANGDWPTALSDMQPAPSGSSTIPYVPANISSPWPGSPYDAKPIGQIPSTSPPKYMLFQVSVTLPATLHGAAAIAATLAGKLPYGQSTSVAPFTVTAAVNLPGQNVNNATAVNFAGLYHNGACVPVPTCPVTDASGNPMTPEVIVTPVSLSGANDAGTTNVYPITSFTAFATGGTNSSPANCGASPDPACDINTSSSGKFWRACVQVVTSKGTVTWDASSSPATAQLPVMMAMTRCIIQNEAAGSDFSVFGP